MDPLTDRRLSFRALGLLLYLRSLPPGADVRRETLAEAHTDGVTSVRTALQELRLLGYLEDMRGRTPRKKRQPRVPNPVKPTDYRILPSPPKPRVTGQRQVINIKDRRKA